MDGISQVRVIIIAPELMAVKSNVIINPITKDDLYKAIILFEEIASILLPKFTGDTNTPKINGIL